MKQKAEHFAINDEGTLVWRVHKDIAYVPAQEYILNPPNSTTSWEIAAQEGGGVIEVALTKDTAWYLTNSGEVYVQLRLPSMGILSRCESPWSLCSIAASEVAVWALQSKTGRLVVRAGLKYSPMGMDWVEVVPDGPTHLISISLYSQGGWALDEMGSLWFANGVSYQSPFGTSGAWMQVCSPWNDSQSINRLNKWSVRVSSAGVFVCVGRKIYWGCASGPISGHNFHRVVPDKLVIEDSFELISAGNLKGGKRGTLVLCRSNEIYLYHLANCYFCSLPTFPSSYGCNIVELCTFKNSVYILESSGCIYVRKEICDLSPFGGEWKLLDTGLCGSPIVSFAVTSCSLWVVTASGELYVYVREVEFDPLAGTNPTWIYVKPPNSCVVDKVRASLSGLYVWIFSKSTGRSWARCEISNRFVEGKTWSEANTYPGVNKLAVGCKVIWSLSSSGQLYRLHGLAAGNPAGNYWKPVPAVLKAISIGQEDRLWALDNNNHIVAHKIDLYPPTFERSVHDDFFENNDGVALDYVTY